jgi:hypothetical protein
MTKTMKKRIVSEETKRKMSRAQRSRHRKKNGKSDRVTEAIGAGIHAHELLIATKGDVKRAIEIVKIVDLTVKLGG